MPALPTSVPFAPRRSPAAILGAEAAKAAANGNQVAEFVRSRFPGVKVQKVDPTTGYVTVDLSKADGRTRRMLRDADPKAYYLLDNGNTAVLQVTGPLRGSPRRSK